MYFTVFFSNIDKIHLLHFSTRLIIYIYIQVSFEFMYVCILSFDYSKSFV